MGLPKRRGGLPVLLSGSRQPGAWQAPRRPHDSDRPVPARGVRAFCIGRAFLPWIIRTRYGPQPEEKAACALRVEPPGGSTHAGSATRLAAVT